MQSRSSSGVSSDVSSNASLKMPESTFQKVLVKQPLQAGAEGSPVELLSNFFKIRTTGKIVFYYVAEMKKVAYNREDAKTGSLDDYEASKESKGLDMFLKRFSSEILKLYFENNPQAFAGVSFVHDGVSKVYSMSKFDLSSVPEVQTYDIQGRESRFAIKLTLHSKIDLNEVDKFYVQKSSDNISQAVISVYEQVFRHVIEQKYSFFQRSFFSFSHREASKNAAFELVSGFNTSVRMTEFGLALNIHNRTTSVVSQQTPTLFQFVKSILNVSNLDFLTGEQLKVASRFLHGLKVETIHTGETQTFTIDCLSPETTDKHTFTTKDGQKVTVREHFEKQYMMSIRSLNLVKTSVTKRNDSGEGYKIHLPMEVCRFVENQFVCEFKLPPSVQTELLRRSSSPPPHYFTQITKFAEEIATINPKLLRDFGIELTPAPVKFPARIVEQPKLLDNEGKFYQVAELPDQWAVVCFDKSHTKASLDKFIKEMRETAKAKGMAFEPPFPVTFVDPSDVYTIFNCFDNLRKFTKVTFVLFVLPSRKFAFLCLHFQFLTFLFLENDSISNTDIYHAVKYFSDTEVDFISQCARGEKFRDIRGPPRGYYDNILDKINGKLGGLVSKL